MAIIKLGPLIAGIRGTVGGTVFTAGKAGPYARAWSKGPNPRTTSQTTQRAIVSTMSQEWRDITAGQRNDWRAYAALGAQELTNSLGEPYFASGWNWFCRINTHLNLSAAPPRAAPPAGATPAAPTLYSIEVKTPNTANHHVWIGFPVDEFTGYNVIAALALWPSLAMLTLYRGYRYVYYGFQSDVQHAYIGNSTRPIFGNPVLSWQWSFHIARQNNEGRRSASVTRTGEITPS